MREAIVLLLIWIALVFASGYLLGLLRHRIRVDGLHAEAIAGFVALAVSAVAYNLGASWWRWALVLPAVSLTNWLHTVSVGLGTQRAGRRVVIVSRERKS